MRRVFATVILAVLVGSGLHADGHMNTADAAKKVRKSLGYGAGTIVIVNDERKLYFVLGKGQALQYPIAVGRKAQVWTGRTQISRMVEDPTWLNPDDPNAEEMPAGPDNPLGARALYLGSTLYRIHGTPAKDSIGRAVSNGCVRMFNADVKDLYNKVKVGTKVVALNALAEAGAVPAKPSVVNLALYKRDQERKRLMLARRNGLEPAADRSVLALVSTPRKSKAPLVIQR